MPTPLIRVAEVPGSGTFALGRVARIHLLL